MDEQSAPTPQQLQGLSVNFQGLKNNPEKIEYLKEIAQSDNVGMILCCETWLDENIDNVEVGIPGFNVFRTDRKHRIRGGSAIYLKKNFCVDESRLLKFCNDVCEVTALIIEDCDIALISLYRPPDTCSSEFKEALDAVKLWFEENCTDNTHVLFYGDFNFPWLSWYKLESSDTLGHTLKPGSTNDEKKQSKELLSFMSSNFLLQTVHELTNNCNTVDLQFTNSDIFSSPYVMPTTISDHDFLCWSVNLMLNNNQPASNAG